MPYEQYKLQVIEKKRQFHGQEDKQVHKKLQETKD